MNKSHPTGAAQLRALVQLINNSVEDIIAQYDALGEDVPTLDKTSPVKFDFAENCNEQLTESIRIIEGACAQLSITVANPGHVAANKAFSFTEPACLKVAYNNKFADILDNHPKGVHLDEISKSTGIERGKLARVLRHLATRHVFKEVSPQVFTNNRISMKLRRTDPVGALVGHLSDEVMTSATNLNEALVDPTFGPSYSVAHTPFSKAFNTQIFDYYSSAAGKARAERFNEAMIGWNWVSGNDYIIHAYPWKDLPVDTILCDVGGGRGHVTHQILKTYPHLKAVVQDLEPVMEDAKLFWNNEDPKALDSGRVQLSSFDFFKGAPKPGCDIYYLRCVIHDWPDAECVKILENVRKAMKPESRVLLHEYTLQPLTKQNDPALKEAPEPLLPNYGLGKVRVTNVDIDMMSCTNSKERSIAEFSHLAEQAGLQFVKTWKCVDMVIMEFIPVDEKD